MTRPGLTVLVTMCTDGIGAQTARLFAERGARILVHGGNAERVADAAEPIGRVGGRSLRLGESGVYFDRTTPSRANEQAYGAQARARLRVATEGIGGYYA